jgi:hypothetical protein
MRETSFFDIPLGAMADELEGGRRCAQHRRHGIACGEESGCVAGADDLAEGDGVTILDLVEGRAEPDDGDLVRPGQGWRSPPRRPKAPFGVQECPARREILVTM